jgi:hypothetical protein
MTQPDESTTVQVQVIVDKLDEKREELIYRVAEALFSNIPVVGISTYDHDKVMHHHRNMAITAERFHEILQAGATIDWQLVSSEFEWADRKLGTMGITHEHHQTLINTYFQEALDLCEWSPDERSTLEWMAAQLRDAAAVGYDNAATITGEPAS